MKGFIVIVIVGAITYYFLRTASGETQIVFIVAMVVFILLLALWIKVNIK